MPEKNSSSNPQYLSEWCRHTEGVTPEQMQLNLSSAKAALDVLKNMLESKQKKYDNDFDCPNWALKQAHKTGFNEALDLIARLIP